MQAGPNSFLALGCISWMWHEWLPAMEEAQIPSLGALCSSEHQRVVVEGATIWGPFLPGLEEGAMYRLTVRVG